MNATTIILRTDHENIPGEWDDLAVVLPMTFEGWAPSGDALVVFAYQVEIDRADPPVIQDYGFNDVVIFDVSSLGTIRKFSSTHKFSNPIKDEWGGVTYLSFEQYSSFDASDFKKDGRILIRFRAREVAVWSLVMRMTLGLTVMSSDRVKLPRCWEILQHDLCSIFECYECENERFVLV